MLMVRHLSADMCILAGSLAVLIATPILADSAVAQAKTAPSVVGKKYSDAKSALSDAGFSAVVASTVGDRLAWSDCIVVNQRDRSRPAPPNSGGSPTAETLVALNCDQPVASAIAPGNSRGSPEGRAAAASTSSKPAQPSG